MATNSTSSSALPKNAKVVVSGLVRRYLDSKDCAAMSNLKTHAIKCFGANVIEAAANKTQSSTRDGSIFAVFARQGQQPVTTSHRALTNEETQYVSFLLLI